jgi:DNA-binding response OmpR family regulator
MTGSEICKTLKAQSDTKHIPVIMVSADSCLARVVKDCGAEDYLNKPFNISVLLSKIKKYTS